MKSISIILLVGIIISASGCAGIRESARSVAGVSIRKLDDARDTATRAEFTCTVDQCFDFTAARAQEDGLLVLQKNRERLFLVVTQIPGVVNSSEVGIFFVPTRTQQTRVEIASPSELAKRKLAQWLLPILNAQFPIPEPPKATP